MLLNRYRLLVATLLLASSASALKTKWSMPVDFGGDPVAKIASNSDFLFVADSQGAIKAVNATSGAHVWSAPGFAKYTTDGVALGGEHNDLLLATYSPTNQSDNAFIGGFDAKTGAPLYNITMPKSVGGYVHGGFVSLGKKNLVIGVDYVVNLAPPDNLELRMYNFDLSDGHMVWKKTQPMEAATAGHVGDNIIVALGLPKGETSGWTAGFSFDLATGDFICNFSAGTASISQAGDAIVGRAGRWDEFVAIYDGSKKQHGSSLCKLIKKFDSSNVTPVKPISVDGDFFFKAPVAGKPKEINVTRLKQNGARAWSTTVKASYGTKYFSVGNAAFQPGVVIINTAGTFTTLNATTGREMRNTNTTIPFAARNSHGQQVFPLGHHTLFVPNLQGYVVLDAKNGGTVKAINEQAPPTSAVSFMDAASGKPFVAYGDLVSGLLKAVEL